MKFSKAFTAFAAVYFALVFLKDGTLLKLTKQAGKAANTFVAGSRKLTRLT